jgi:hypothetical protein
MSKLNFFEKNGLETLKRLVLSALLLLGLVVPAQALTIDFDALAPGEVFVGQVAEGFRTSPINGQGWTQPSGIGGDSTPAVFTTLEGVGNIQSYLLTYVPFAEHADAEFFFQGIDLYSSVPMSTSSQYSIFVVGLEGPDPGPEVFRFQPILEDNQVFHHISADGFFAWDGAPVSESVIGALYVSILRGTGGPTVTVGVDNINLCRNDGGGCTFNEPLNFTIPNGTTDAQGNTATEPPIVPDGTADVQGSVIPETPFIPDLGTGTQSNVVPEPSSMMLIGSGLAAIAKLRRKKSV